MRHSAALPDFRFSKTGKVDAGQCGRQKTNEIKHLARAARLPVFRFPLIELEKRKSPYGAGAVASPPATCGGVRDAGALELLAPEIPRLRPAGAGFREEKKEKKEKKTPLRGKQACSCFVLPCRAVLLFSVRPSRF